MEFKFRQEVSETDFVIFYNYHIRRTLLRPFNLVLSAMFVLILLAGPFFGSPETLYYGLGFIAIIVLLYFYMNRQGKKLYQRDPDSFNMDYVINENGLRFESKDGFSEKMWSEFESMVISEEYVYIYLKNKRGLLFKKEICGNEVIDFLTSKGQEVMRPKNIVTLTKK